MATKSKADTGTTDKVESDSAKKNRLYSEALREVRDAHPDEFNAAIERLYSENGFTYRRRLTAEEKAQREAEERKVRAEKALAKVREQYGDVLDLDKPEPDVTPGVTEA